MVLPQNYHDFTLKQPARLGLCGGLSLLSASLALLEMDVSVSDTAAATVAARPRGLALHLAQRATEMASRLWVWCVLASLSSQWSVRGGSLQSLQWIFLEI